MSMEKKNEFNIQFLLLDHQGGLAFAKCASLGKLQAKNGLSTDLSTTLI